MQRGLDGPLRPHAIWAQFGVTLEKAIYKNGDPNHFNILESFFNNSKWSKNLKTTLFVNAWDCWSMLGNGNFGDKSADGFWGRTTAISLLGWPGSNSQIKRQPVEITEATSSAPTPVSGGGGAAPVSSSDIVEYKGKIGALFFKLNGNSYRIILNDKTGIPVVKVPSEEAEKRTRTRDPSEFFRNPKITASQLTPKLIEKKSELEKLVEGDKTSYLVIPFSEITETTSSPSTGSSTPADVKTGTRDTSIDVKSPGQDKIKYKNSTDGILFELTSQYFIIKIESDSITNDINVFKIGKIKYDNGSNFDPSKIFVGILEGITEKILTENLLKNIQNLKDLKINDENSSLNIKSIIYPLCRLGEEIGEDKDNESLLFKLTDQDRLDLDKNYSGLEELAPGDSLNKPKGFWFAFGNYWLSDQTVDMIGAGCDRETHMLKNYKNDPKKNEKFYQINLDTNSSKILNIVNTGDIDKYKNYFKDIEKNKVPNWKKIFDDFSGIIVYPEIFIRLGISEDNPFYMFYVPSGVIWKDLEDLIVGSEIIYQFDEKIMRFKKINQIDKRNMLSLSPLSYKRQVSPTGKIRSIQEKKNNRVKNLKKEMKKKQK